MCLSLGACVFFNRKLLIYIIGITLGVTYNQSMASPPFGGFNDAYSKNAAEIEKRQRNPWTRQMPRQRGYGYGQPFTPKMPKHNETRFISEEELEALNNQSIFLNESDYSHGWKPLPSMEGLKQRPRYTEPQQPQSYDNRFTNDYGAGLRPNMYQGNQPSMVMPFDPMDPGQSGAPFSGPFRGIDSFMYE